MGYRIASVSWGKDSLAMLLMLIERGEELDEVVFYDTGLEFDVIYDVRDQTLPLLDERGIKYTELRPRNPMWWDMFCRPVIGDGLDCSNCGAIFDIGPCDKPRFCMYCRAEVADAD